MNPVQNWGEAVSNSLLNMWMGFVEFLPALLGAILVFVIGLVIASVLGKAVERILRATRIDAGAEKLGLYRKMQAVNLETSMSHIFGELVRWFLIIVFLMATTDILQLGEVTSFLRGILAFIPNIIVVTIILAAAFLLGELAHNIIRTSTKAAGVLSAELLAKVARALIVVFGFLMAIEQLGIADSILSILVTGIIAALSLAFGLAFGLGGRDEAALILKKVREDIARK